MVKRDCTTPFANGTEFELFVEKCTECSRFLNGRCAILSKCFKAQWDISEFPYEYLWEYDTVVGKECKRFTTEPIERKETDHPLDGQMAIWENAPKEG